MADKQPKHRKNVPMTPRAGKAPAMTQKEFDEGLDAALRATQPKPKAKGGDGNG